MWRTKEVIKCHIFYTCLFRFDIYFIRVFLTGFAPKCHHMCSCVPHQACSHVYLTRDWCNASQGCGMFRLTRSWCFTSRGADVCKAFHVNVHLARLRGYQLWVGFRVMRYFITTLSPTLLKKSYKMTVLRYNCMHHPCSVIEGLVVLNFELRMKFKI